MSGETAEIRMPRGLSNPQPSKKSSSNDRVHHARKPPMQLLIGGGYGSRRCMLQNLYNRSARVKQCYPLTANALGTYESNVLVVAV